MFQENIFLLPLHYLPGLGSCQENTGGSITFNKQKIETTSIEHASVIPVLQNNSTFQCLTLFYFYGLEDTQMKVDRKLVKSVNATIT